MRCTSLVLLVSGLLVSSSVSAHGDSPSLEAEVNGYLIDIGYEGDIVAGSDIEFDIDLFKVGPPVDYAEFASVDVRVTKDGAEIVAGSVENDVAHVPMITLNFPDAGGYDMDVRFLDATDTLIVARTFHVEVLGGAQGLLRQGFTALHYAIAAGLFALSAGIAVVSLRKRFWK